MGNLHLVKDYAWTEDDHKVSETMLNYFANFIIKGDPNGEKLPSWPASDPGDSTPAVMVIDTESKAVDVNDDRYIFLDKTYKN
jgi:para-nitrobenzyl esterase